MAAIKAAQLGLKVTCIEKRGSLGGTCLNVGCIPSKALLHASHMFELTKGEMAHAGVLVDNARVDLAQMMKTKEKTVTGLTGGIELLFNKNKVKYEKGFGRFASKDTIEVLDEKGTVIKTVKTKNTIIATGSEPAGLNGLVIDEKTIVSSTGALSLGSIPKSMILVGGGVIGLEMGSVWSRLGTQVTVVEYTDAICAGADAEVAKNFKRILEKQGLIFKMKSAVKGGVIQKDGTVKVAVEDNETKKIEDLRADIVLVAVGRKPYTEGLGLEKIGVKVDKRGIIETDDHFRTGVPGVFAIGDVIKGPMLAHKAEEEGIACVESIVTAGAGHVNYNAIPSVIYTNPEVAWVGLTEEQAKAKGLKYKIGKFPMIANSRARANNETTGFVKFISDAETDRILGVHIIGSNAGELIAEPTLAIEYGASSEDLARTCHAHPTVAEAVKEAAMAVYDKPIHI